MNRANEIQSAVNDLAIIRRAIEKAGNQDPSTPHNAFAIDAGLFVQCLCLVVSAALLVFELVSGRNMTEIMMLSAQDTEIGILGLSQVAIAIPVFVMCIYFIAWRAAQRSGQGFQDYLVRNFRYLKNLGLVSDLLTKFIPLSLLVVGKHPEWIPSLLSLYIADYLIQGRFFTIPVRLSLGLGVLSIVAAFLQYQGNAPELLWPLLHFVSVAGISVGFLVRARTDKSKSIQPEKAV